MGPQAGVSRLFPFATAFWKSCFEPAPEAPQASMLTITPLRPYAFNSRITLELNLSFNLFLI